MATAKAAKKSAGGKKLKWVVYRARLKQVEKDLRAAQKLLQVSVDTVRKLHARPPGNGVQHGEK